MRNTSGRSLLLLAALALVVANACVRASRAPAPAAPSGLQCERGYAVMVNNGTPEVVDVWQSTTSGRDVYIGSVSGRTTSDLPLTSGTAVIWRWPPENPPRYHPFTDVTLHVHCT